MTVDAVRAELAANLQDAQRAADEWRTRALAAEAQRDLLGEILGELDAALCRDTYALSDIPDHVRSVVAERDLLAGIIRKMDDGHTRLTSTEAEAVRHILAGEDER